MRAWKSGTQTPTAGSSPNFKFTIRKWLRELAAKASTRKSRESSIRLASMLSQTSV